MFCSTQLWASLFRGVCTASQSRHWDGLYSMTWKNGKIKKSTLTLIIFTDCIKLKITIKSFKIYFENHIGLSKHKQDLNVMADKKPHLLNFSWNFFFSWILFRTVENTSLGSYSTCPFLYILRYSSIKTLSTFKT